MFVSVARLKKLDRCAKAHRFCIICCIICCAEGPDVIFFIFFQILEDVAEQGYN